MILSRNHMYINSLNTWPGHIPATLSRTASIDIECSHDNQTVHPVPRRHVSCKGTYDPAGHKTEPLAGSTCRGAKQSPWCPPMQLPHMQRSCPAPQKAPPDNWLSACCKCNVVPAASNTQMLPGPAIVCPTSLELASACLSGLFGPGVTDHVFVANPRSVIFTVAHVA